MAKRTSNYNDMDVATLRSEISTLNRRMEEVITILGGNSAYDVKGMRSDVKDLKADVSNIKVKIETIEKENVEREKKEGFLSIKLDTIPQKIVAFMAFIAVFISVVQGIKSLFAPL
jgi:seryl-tRNA synthetase